MSILPFYKLSVDLSSCFNRAALDDQNLTHGHAVSPGGEGINGARAAGCAYASGCGAPPYGALLDAGEPFHRSLHTTEMVRSVE